MPEIATSGARIVYDDIGTGEPTLLFLPGWCEPRTVFKHLAPMFAGEHRVLVMDWRGQGDSEAKGDFTARDWLNDCVSVIQASGARQVVPVAISHAGRVAIEARKALGAHIPHLVHLNWTYITDPPPEYHDALKALQDAAQWKGARDRLFESWIGGSDHAEVIAHVRDEIGAFDFASWSRALREIAAGYAVTPLQALAALAPPAPAMHIYSQPRTPDYLAAQKRFAGQHPWFSYCRLEAATHFPALEVPKETAAAIRSFLA